MKTEFTIEQLSQIFAAHVNAACFYIEKQEFPVRIENGMITVTVSHGKCGSPSFLFPGTLLAAKQDGSLELFINLETMRMVINHS